MKAIHNLLGLTPSLDNVGNYKLKYNFESNSQLYGYQAVSFGVGNYKLKYNFESNSQQAPASHVYYNVGNYKLKYNFESNSQQQLYQLAHYPCWEL